MDANKFMQLANDVMLMGHFYREKGDATRYSGFERMASAYPALAADIERHSIAGGLEGDEFFECLTRDLRSI